MWLAVWALLLFIVLVLAVAGIYWIINRTCRNARCDQAAFSKKLERDAAHTASQLVANPELQNEAEVDAEIESDVDADTEPMHDPDELLDDISENIGETPQTLATTEPPAEPTGAHLAQAPFPVIVKKSRATKSAQPTPENSDDGTIKPRFRVRSRPLFKQFADAVQQQ